MSTPRAEQFSTLAEVSHAVASILDLDTLLHEVVTIIRRKVDYLGPRSAVHLYIVDPVREQIVFRAGVGPGNQRFDGAGRQEPGPERTGLIYDFNAPTDESPPGIIPWVARHCQTVVANNVELDARYRPLSDFRAAVEPGELDTTASELTVPLAFSGEVLGVLDVQSDQKDAFSEQDRLLFEALADSVAIAIRNANLYRAERWRRQVADSLHQVAGLLSAEVMLEEVLDTVLAELERTLPCDLAAIWLLEDDELHLPAVRGPAYRGPAHHDPTEHEGTKPAAVEPKADKVSSEERTTDELAANAVLADKLSAAITPDPGTWLGHALEAERPIIRAPETRGPQENAGLLSAPDPLAQAFDFPADHSAIAAPLRIGSQRLGLLTLSHREPGRYGAESRTILTTFASYAAVAIENARLFQEAQEQALISTVMLQVAKVSQSYDALDQVLGAVTELTAQLVDVNRCAILLWDQARLAFVPGAAWGMNPSQESLFEQAQLSPGDVPALDELLVNGTPVVLYRVEPGLPAIESQEVGRELPVAQQPTEATQDAETASAPGSVENWLAELGFESLLMLPLLSQGAVQGAILIEGQDDLFASGVTDRPTLSAMLDQRLVMLQGIAYQAAAAIENARLREAQEAEAYVSAALLQVSQAVNNLHTLNEILEAIVRITPILVGVEQCLIYLWEERTSTFRLAQSYGVSYDQHAVLARETFSRGEFGLLDSVCDQNQPVSYTLTPCPDRPSLQSNEDPLPNGWQEHLDRERPAVRSLLAIPLAVKDVILGVMLLAEPHNATSARRPHYSEEKRLEIMTGIAHQAALTVQNERLQQARLSSERMERELELAREIQQTFIPNSRLVDQVDSGWDISVEWRAARHVAGDFYDLIELPGKRLGLVVADVADKGMPAALLMALTRTLLRATALQERSPATVLARVNDLLVPDAKRGMFVTAAYAVLCLESGELVYANAGHCRPLLHSGRGQLQSLPKGGMALGVTAGLEFKDHRAELAPGDRLVLYSDGVTEAFSPEGELYGETRLRQVLKSHPNGSAQSLLNAILDSVHRFTQDATPDDDLTLLVLGRTRGPHAFS